MEWNCLLTGSPSSLFHNTFVFASHPVGLYTCVKLAGGAGRVWLHFMGVETAYYLAPEWICEFRRLLR